MPALKCPNPSCPFLFDPSLVPPGSIVTCPRCGMRFTLGPVPPAPPPMPGPETLGFDPSASPNSLTTTHSSTDPHPEPATESPPRPASPSPEIAVLPKADRVGLKLLLIGGLMLVALIGGSIAIYLFVPKSGGGLNNSGSTFQVADKNFSFVRPPAGWTTDNETRTAMNLTALAYRRVEPPEAWVALSVTDYDSRTPFLSELRDKALEHLNRGFDNVPSELELQPIKWAGQDAHTVRLRVQMKNSDAPCILDATFMTYRGWAYWLYTWSRQEDFDALAQELDSFRESFQLLGGRANRKPPPVRQYTYRNSSGKYQLNSFEDIWSEPKGLRGQDFDQNGDLFLKAELKVSGRRDARPVAELLVMVVPDAGDAQEVADRYIQDRHKRNEDVLGKVQLSVYSSEPSGDEPPGTMEPKTEVTRLYLRRGTDASFKTADKLIVYSAIRLGNQVVIAEGSCPWLERERWERRLIQLVGSLQP